VQDRDGRRLPPALQSLPVRISEANSMHGGGARFVSDRYASALWAADHLMEMAKAGVSGVNYHWSSGGQGAGM